VIYKDGYSYKGGIMDMKREGHGLLTGVDYVYQGDWEQDKRHGQGKETRGN